MLTIDVSDLKPGMKFDKALLAVDTGAKLTPANTPLSEQEIGFLQKWGIKQVKTEGTLIAGKLEVKPKSDATAEKNKTSGTVASHKPVKNEKIKALRQYDEWIDRTSTILQGLSTGMKVNRNDIVDLIDKLILAVPKNKNAFISIVQSKGSKEYIYGHSLNVAILSIIIGSGMKYHTIKLRTLGTAALLHDLGMLKIPKHIREKQHALSEADINLIKKHPEQSYNIIKKYGAFDETIADIAHQHHEAYDGSGYPKGISNIEINEYAKIISVVDTFDAMTKKRVYRDEKIPHNIMKELLKGVEKKFDPMIMKAVLTSMAIYPVGSVVRLNSNDIGIVISANETSPLKPVVKILYNSSLQKLDSPRITDLLEDKDLKITAVVNPKDLGISVIDEF